VIELPQRLQRPGKPNDHFITTLQCDDCHTTSRWGLVKYTHSSGGFPGGHSGEDCDSCHKSRTSAITWKFPSYKPDCAGCHAGDFEQEEHKKYTTPTTAYYSVSDLRDCTGACHLYTNSSMTTIKENRSGKHRPSGDW